MSLTAPRLARAPVRVGVACLLSRTFPGGNVVYSRATSPELVWLVLTLFPTGNLGGLILCPYLPVRRDDAESLCNRVRIFMKMMEAEEMNLEE